MRELLGLILCMHAFAQTASNIGRVHRVCLAFAAKSALDGVKHELARELQKSGGLTLADSPDAADAILAADGDVFIKGYISLNPRAGNAPNRGEPVRGGFLSVELKGKGGETLWSYLATPRFGSTHIERDLARQIIRQLLEATRKARP